MVSLSYASAIKTQQEKTLEEKISPLFKIRTKQWIREGIRKDNKIVANYLNKVFNDRVFSLSIMILQLKNKGLNNPQISFFNQCGNTENYICGTSTSYCGTCDVNGNCAPSCVNLCGKDHIPD